MKPDFPEFKKLEISDKETIDNFTKNFEPYSDFNFVSMFTWDINNDMEFSFINNNLVVKFKDYNSDNYFYSFLGDNKCVETSIKLLQYTKEFNSKNTLKLIPEVVVNNILRSENIKIDIKEDRGDWDYVIDLLKTK
ncbi:MAG: hypothetical protein ACE5RI_10495, partial [Candidatus Nitrosomaritimum yanchengensis]